MQQLQSVEKKRGAEQAEARAPRYGRPFRARYQTEAGTTSGSLLAVGLRHKLPSHGEAHRPRHVAELLVDAPHALVSRLGPGDELADPVGRRPGELSPLQRGREPAAPPLAVDRREPVLGSRVVIVPGQQPGVADDAITVQSGE